MLIELASLTWLNWFYRGQDFVTFGKTIKDEYEYLDWNEQNIIDIYQVVEQVNQDYRLYDGVKNTKPSSNGGLALTLNLVFSVLMLVNSIILISI